MLRELHIVVAVVALPILCGVSACTSFPSTHRADYQQQMVDEALAVAAEECFSKRNPTESLPPDASWLQIQVWGEIRLTLIREDADPGMTTAKIERLNAKAGHGAATCGQLIETEETVIDGYERDIFKEIQSIRQPLDIEAVIIIHQPVINISYRRPGLSFTAEWFRSDTSPVATWAEGILVEIEKLSKGY